MKQTMIIKLPARKNIPETSLYAEIYTQSGKLGERDLMMLVPGGPGNDHTTYDSPDHSIARALAPYIDIILFDPRGCGSSEKSEPQYCTLEYYVDDIESIREYFQIPANQFVIFGQSYGSIAALGYAIKYPLALKKLAIIGGAASSDFLAEAKENLLKNGTTAQQQFAQKLWTGTFTGTPEEVAEYYEVMGPLYAYTFKPGGPTPSLTYNVAVLNLGFSQFLKTFDYRSKLSQVKCKTLIFWGNDDWISDKKQANIIHQNIVGSELLIYQQCSHLLWIDQWDKFIEKMIHFISLNSRS